MMSLSDRKEFHLWFSIKKISFTRIFFFIEIFLNICYSIINSRRIDMKRISKKVLTVFAVIAMVFSYFIPFNVIKAAAPADPSGYGIISINNPLDVQGGDNVNQIIGTYEHGTFTISGTGMYTQSNNVYAVGEVIIDISPETNIMVLFGLME
jgi:hypothetical protein